jgi:formylmethanofuran dehydrogenase subunit B
MPISRAMSATVVRSAACMFCGCLCDDIELHTDGMRVVKAVNACALGDAWFAAHTAVPDGPAALVDGRPAPLDEAVATAGAILRDAHLPLVYGLGNVTCEAQREAVALTEAIGGVIDSHTSLGHGPTEIAAQLGGIVMATLGEVARRADLVVYWGANPAESHPRHVSKYSLMPSSARLPHGRADRTMVLVDVRETPSARDADVFLRVRPDSDFEVLTVVRALLKGRRVTEAAVEPTGLTLAALEDLVGRMTRARYGAMFFGTGLTMTRGRHMNAAALLALTAELNAVTKFVCVPMRGHGNDAGADAVLRSATGYTFGVDFSRGHPRYNPGEFSAADLLARGECDAALVLGADPGATMPRRAAEHLARIPTIVLDPRVTHTSRLARVHITTAASGISAAGTACRMDTVPLPLRPALVSSAPTDETVVRRLREAVGDAHVSQGAGG